MAELLYGHVYFFDRFAGVLRQEPGDRCSFTYDAEFLEGQTESISLSLPLKSAAHIYAGRLHPYFDNLLSEGRQARIQARWLGIPVEDRFRRLLAFGGDCIGAVTVRDPEPRPGAGDRSEFAADMAFLNSRASISGVQTKLLVVETDSGFRPAVEGELSTHIAKLASGSLPEIVPLEYLTTLATRIFLPEDEVAETRIGPIPSIADNCLLVRRFDRPRLGGIIVKQHFEEFNQILGHASEDKYVGRYGEMAEVLRSNARCSLKDVERLFRRVLVSVLVGNNDAHLKNFALLYREGRLALSPFFDILAAALYPEYSQTGMALRFGQGTNPRNMAEIGPAHLKVLAASFGLKAAAVHTAAMDLSKRVDPVQEAVRSAPHGSQKLRKRLGDYIIKRWNGTFRQLPGLTGQRS